MALEKAGRYELLEEIGRGAMGVVYRARDPLIGRTVAVKALRLDEFNRGKEEPDLLDRFQNEIRAAGRLTHPNIVVIHDAGVDRDAGVFYITMEYVLGKSLQGMIAEKQAFPLPRLLRIMEQACRALDFAHNNHIVHRDIKPANILVGELDTLKITDFGTAKILERGGTQSGQIIGTPSYMAPEQVKGRPVDGRADVFALTVILYELLTGERPFPGKNVTTVIYKIVHEDPISPIQIDSSIHPGLNAVILKGLAKDPGERFQNCSDFLAALRNYRETAGSQAGTVIRRISFLPPTRPVIAGQTVTPPRGTLPQPDTLAQFSAVSPVQNAPPPATASLPKKPGESAQPEEESQPEEAPAPTPPVAGRPAPPSPPRIVSLPEEPGRSSHAVLWSLLLLLVAGGAGGYFYWPEVQMQWQKAAAAMGIARETSKPGQTPSGTQGQNQAAGAATSNSSGGQQPSTTSTAAGAGATPTGNGAAEPAGTAVTPSPPPEAVPEFPAELLAARDRLGDQLQKLGLSDRVKIAPGEHALVLSGQLTAAEHRALFHRLPVLPGKPRVIDQTVVEKPAGGEAGAASAGIVEPRGSQKSWIPADKGALDVTSDVSGAQVSLRTPGGNPIADCRTPCRFADLSPGSYLMSVRVAEFPPLERPIEIHAGVLGQERVRMATGGGKKPAMGTVEVLSVPVGADIVINGQNTGRRTPAKIELPPGQYTVTLYLKGYAPFTQGVVVQQSRTAGLQAVLGKQ
jgi:serine/threonine protein kinase